MEQTGMKRFCFTWLSMSLILLYCPEIAFGKWAEGTISPSGPDDKSDWLFLTRFCFLSKVGKMQYLLEYPKEYAVENLLFYYDVPGQWDTVYKRGLTCEEQVAALNNRNIFPLDSGLTMCEAVTRNGREWYSCSGSMDFSSSRERWWYLTVSRCDPPLNPEVNALYLYYKLHMTNGEDLLHKEFSADEFYILLIDIIFFVLYIKLMVMSIVCAVILTNRQLLHSTYKLYMAAITLYTLHLLCMVIAWGSYGNTGWEMRRMEVLGRVIAAGSNIVFILMLILLAKGYTIVRGKLTNKAMVKITSFIAIYIIMAIALFIWEGTFFDPGVVLYYYESPPGYCMVAIILLGWLWFTKAAVFTLKHFKAKTNFYIAFYVIYTIWFWATPIIILIAMFAMAKWTREKTVNGVQLATAYLGHLIFLILTMPNKVNTNFPYHIKTSQIGSMPETGDLPMEGEDQDSSRADSRPASAYALSSSGEPQWSGTGPNLEFFITSKSGGGDQAGGDGGMMYAPLDLSMFYNSENDSPPPAYNYINTTSGDEDLAPQLSTATTTTTTTATAPELMVNHHLNYSNDTDIVNNNRLPPLRQALEGDMLPSKETTLPPIRGSGLPTITASAPPDPDNQPEARRADPPNYDEMFRAKQ